MQARWRKHQLDLAAVFCAGVDGFVQIEFFRTFILVQPLQSPQRDADLASIQDAVATQVLESARLGDLHCRPSAAGSADTNSCWVDAAMTQR